MFKKLKLKFARKQLELTYLIGILEIEKELRTKKKRV